jgi:large repetitive protein
MALRFNNFVVAVALLVLLALATSSSAQHGESAIAYESVSPTLKIGGVIIAEAGPLKNSTLEANEPLKITWAATSQTGSVTKQVLTIDGRQFPSIQGPYGKFYYCCRIGVIGDGHHTYTIQATDSSSTGTITGSFDVTAAIGPTIADVVIAEAAVPRDGNLASNERLVITWAVSSPTRIVSQTVQLDGSIVGPINGPYSGLYSLCRFGPLAIGDHTYTITATDSLGATSTNNGTFAVVAPYPPSISKMVVAQASGTRTGVLASDEDLVITWAATTTGYIASQTVNVDGAAFNAIRGPYGGMFYSCPVGHWAAGTHTYQINSTDSLLNQFTSTGTFTVVAPPPPTISSVVVVATTTNNGDLKPNEPLEITWSATSARGIAWQSVQIDSTNVVPIHGTSSRLNYYCLIGKWAAGSHTYQITAIDSLGVKTVADGIFVVVDPSNSNAQNSAE